MKKNYGILVTAILIVLSFAACQFPLDNSTSVGTTDSAEYLLPPDTVEDSPRVFSGNFTYETLVAVELDLRFELYDSDETEGLVKLSFDGSEENQAPKVYVTVKDSAGNRLYAAGVSADAALKQTLHLPSASKDIELVLEAEGFETRRVTVANMAKFSVISRTMSMLREKDSGSKSLNMQSKGTGPMKDTDGDGVPDKYDLYPDDPTAAFEMNVPAAESITIAFEDLFGRKNAGDADYNDFIATYTINEILNADGMITRVEVQAEAVQKLAGYNHSFGIRIDSYTGQANLTGSFTNRGGQSARLGGRPKAPAEIVLFERTAGAVGKNAWFVLEFDTPQDPSAISSPPYNPYLYVQDTRHDIHLIDAEPLKNSINPHDRFIDADGFPWALLIPADWEHPAEGQRIEEVYPYFTDWRESGGMEYEDWYEKDGEEPPTGIPDVVGADIADEDPATEGIQVSFWYGAGSFDVQLVLDGSVSPSESILFRSSPLPSYLSLNETTGVITVTPDWSEHSDTVEFWSEGVTSGDDTSDTPLRIDFSAVSG
ncbi:LruC domain-containing protein [Marispirochaeta sp.]|uniref:LruC domain-containing protein n=1 Tax=Marispirochaeta sp. TaxID=2038653 RepID=UPI0029C9A099|nr:LruC domain-containing protein [Marispirochaeta sp.]